MLFVFFVLGSCALLTSGVLSIMLWVVFYAALGFVVFSNVLHWAIILRSLPKRPFPQDGSLYVPGAPYWRKPEDLTLPGQSDTLFPIYGDLS